MPKINNMFYDATSQSVFTLLSALKSGAKLHHSKPFYVNTKRMNINYT